MFGGGMTMTYGFAPERGWAVKYPFPSQIAYHFSSTFVGSYLLASSVICYW